MNNYDDRSDFSNNDIDTDKEKKKGIDLISLLLLLLGVTLLAFGIYFLVEPKIQHKKQDAAAQELLDLVEEDSLTPTITFRADQLIVNGEEGQEETFFTIGPDGVENGTSGNGAENGSNEAPMVTVYGMGSLRIPSINLVMPLANNTDTYSLRVAIGHFPSSALPHEIGTGVYFGHRMTSDGRYFNRLNEVGVGSQVLIDYQGTRYTYTVDKHTIIPVADLASVVFRENTSEQRILLVTCHPLNSPIGQSPERILVEAYLTDVSGQ